jgi:predicted GIY-YIG superfamily endonuclease
MYQDQWVVYLIHFERPYYHARHYLGTTNNLDQRLQQHRQGTRYGGARLMEVVTQAGIAWEVVRTWPGGRQLERYLKSWKSSPRFCPVCEAQRQREQMSDDTVAEEDLEQGGWF